MAEIYHGLFHPDAERTVGALLEVAHWFSTIMYHYEPVSDHYIFKLVAVPLTLFLISEIINGSNNNETYLHRNLYGHNTIRHIVSVVQQLGFPICLLNEESCESAFLKVKQFLHERDNHRSPDTLLRLRLWMEVLQDTNTEFGTMRDKYVTQ